ncbi:MAG TPA: GntR family transcriptional regulator [Actinokineospora sp.]|jgi:DNA-binding GntR family transcriptional regulator|nr:GntR family transcriptional regulator [Actinokineospora sp.]
MADTPRRQVLTDTVYDMIHHRLVEHEIEPGSKVNINALAVDLDVSPTPVREALARLEADGLVLKRSLAGYTAAPLLSGAGFDDLFEMRLLLEPAAASRAATKVTAADLADLDEQLAAMRAASPDAGQPVLRSFLKHDELFHARIATASGNLLMADTLRRLHSHAHLYRLYFRDGIAEATCQEHQRVIDALRDRDPDTAAAAMRSHLRRAKDRLTPAISDGG